MAADAVRLHPHGEQGPVVRFLTVSAALHLVLFGLAFVMPELLSSSPEDNWKNQDTLTVSLSDSLPAFSPAPAVSRGGPAKAPPVAEPVSSKPPPPAEAAPAPARNEPTKTAPAAPSVDKSAVPLMTKPRSIEDRRRLERAEQKKADKAVAAAPSRSKTQAPETPAASDATRRRSELEEKLAQKLKEARDAIALANKTGLEASRTGSSSGPSSGPAASGSGAPGGTANTQSLLASADRVQRGAFDGYRGQIIAAVRDNWEVPASVKGLQLEATFRIELSEDGDVNSSKLVKGSGNRVFDEAVSRTIAATESVGIPPAGFPRIINIVFDNRSLDQ